MPYRICPKCNKALNSSEHFFCSNCGEILPKDLTSRDMNVRVRTTFFKEEHGAYTGILSGFREKASGIVGGISRRPLAEILLLLNLLAVCVLIYQLAFPKFARLLQFSIMPKNDSELSILEVRESTESTVSTGISSKNLGEKLEEIIVGLSSGPILKSEYSKIFPNDTKLVAFGSTIKQLDRILLDSYDSAFTNEISQSTGSYAFGVRDDGNDGYHWVFVLGSLLSDGALESLKKDFDFIFLKQTNQYLIISTSESFIDDIENTMNKNSLSLANNPTYVLKEPYIPNQSGVVLVDLGMGSKNIYQDTKDQAVISDEFKQLLDRFIKSSYNDFILN